MLRAQLASSLQSYINVVPLDGAHMKTSVVPTGNTPAVICREYVAAKRLGNQAGYRARRAVGGEVELLFGLAVPCDNKYRSSAVMLGARCCNKLQVVMT